MTEACSWCNDPVEVLLTCHECMEQLCLACFGPDYEPGAWCPSCRAEEEASK